MTGSARVLGATDVVVVGAGLAGVCAALEAAAAGAEVVLCEKETEPGGSTVLSGGFVALADTPLQHRAGIDDTPRRLFDDLVEVGGGYADEALLRRYVDGVADLHDWLSTRVPFASVHLGAGQSVPRSHVGDIHALFARLLDEVVIDERISLRTSTPVRRLIREPEGRVRGVVVDDAGGPGTLAARRGVVLTSGGFSRSDSLLDTFAPHQERAMRIGGAGNVGDGLRMGWACGADMRDMGQVKGTFGNHPDPTGRPHEILLAFYLGAILVNARGQRFVDESLSYKLLGDACLAQPGARCLQLFDQAVLERSPAGVPLYDITEAQRRGLIVSAPTWTELASAVGVDPGALEGTVERYNHDVVGGVDSVFGRGGLSHGSGDPVPLTTPPFHAFPSTTAVLATYCGLRVSADTQVVDVFDAPIDGLYAAGEITGGFHGRAYMTGSSLGKAAVFGRIAGTSAATDSGRDVDVVAAPVGGRR